MSEEVASQPQPVANGASTSRHSADASKPFKIQLIDASGWTGEREVRFALYDGRPKRLGDGSFGAVYEGIGAGSKPCAIKLLYDNASINPRPLSEISDEELTKIAASVAEICGLAGQKAGEFRELVLNDKNDPDRLVVDLVRLVGVGNGASADLDSNAASIEAILRHLREASSSKSVDRFYRECRISMYLRQADNGRRAALLTGTVEVWGGATNFKSTDTYAEIRQYFEEEKITVSDFALVMDLYDYSLKDLLEKPVGKDATEASVSGYALLRQASLEDRIREALLLLYPITVGLERVHNTKPEKQPFFHLDIKPSNIFIRVDEKSEDFEASLGDLGYLPPELKAKDDRQRDSLIGSQKNELAPGTPHYRSPEQRDHMDVAYVTVTHEGSDPSEALGDQTRLPTSSDATVVLIVKDTKFKSNLIEAEDFVVFSKDKRRTPYTIVKIDPVSNTEQELRIEIDANARDVVQVDRTQVEFHKRQAYRTDLFGIGAIAYDIITAGESPERFYESIRKFEGTDVGIIIEKYRRLRVGQAEVDDPDLLQIFKPFRSGDGTDSAYADEDVVALILKCMLYKSPGTFYAPFSSADKRAERGTAATELKKAIRDVREKPEYLRGSSRSLLIHGRAIAQAGPPPRRIDGEIDMLQGLEPWMDHGKPAMPEALFADDPLLREANRMMLGAFYFLQLVTLVRDYIPTANDTTPRAFLYEMLPEYIMVDQDNENVKLKFDDFTFKDYEAYLKDLRGNRLGRVLRAASNPFVPNWIAGMRRSVKLFGVPDANASPKRDDGVLVVRYRVLDASAFDVRVSAGDWVVIQQQQPVLLSVAEVVDGHTLALKPTTDADALPAEAAFPANAFYYANLDPFKYYLDMLGLYLQHMIFTYSPLTTVTRDKADIIELLRHLGYTDKVLLMAPSKVQPQTPEAPMKSSKGGRGVQPGTPAAPAAPKWQDKSNDLDFVYGGYTYLLLKLTVHGSEDSYYRQKQGLDLAQPGEDPGEHCKRVLNMVSNFARGQYDHMLTLFDKLGTSQPPQRPKLAKELDEELRAAMSNATTNPVGFKEIIQRSGLISPA